MLKSIVSDKKIQQDIVGKCVVDVFFRQKTGARRGHGYLSYVTLQFAAIVP